jgi:hypothetical protein
MAARGARSSKRSRWSVPQCDSPESNSDRLPGHGQAGAEPTRASTATSSAGRDRYGHEMDRVAGFDPHQHCILAGGLRLVDGVADLCRCLRPLRRTEPRAWPLTSCEQNPPDLDRLPINYQMRRTCSVAVRAKLWVTAASFQVDGRRSPLPRGHCSRRASP